MRFFVHDGFRRSDAERRSRRPSEPVSYDDTWRGAQSIHRDLPLADHSALAKTLFPATRLLRAAVAADGAAVAAGESSSQASGFCRGLSVESKTCRGERNAEFDPRFGIGFPDRIPARMTARAGCFASLQIACSNCLAAAGGRVFGRPDKGVAVGAVSA